jgi:polyferredoxin
MYWGRIKIRYLLMLLWGGISNLYLKSFTSLSLLYQGGLKKFCSPTLNCHASPSAIFSCPIGTIQHFLKIGKTPFFVIGLLGLIGILGGRIVCGWLCIFGGLQELLYKIKIKKIAINKKVRFLKYLILVVLVLLLPYFTHTNWFSKLCPLGGLAGGIPLVLISEAMRKLINPFFLYIKLPIVFIFLISSILIRRPFCVVICPLGAIYSFFNKISFLRITLISSKCSHCNLCSKTCPMGLIPYEEVNSLNCIKCLECKKTCPHQAIETKFR